MRRYIACHGSQPSAGEKDSVLNELIHHSEKNTHIESFERTKRPPLRKWGRKEEGGRKAGGEMNRMNGRETH